MASPILNYDPGSAPLGPPEQFPAPVDANAAARRQVPESLAGPLPKSDQPDPLDLLAAKYGGTDYVAPKIDYDAIAEKHGGKDFVASKSAGPVDYDAIAAKYGARDLPATPSIQDHLNRISGQRADIPLMEIPPAPLPEALRGQAMPSPGRGGSPTAYIAPPIRLSPAPIKLPGVPPAPLPQALKSDAQISAEAPDAVNPRTGEHYKTTPMGQSVLDFPYNAAVHATQGVEALAHPAEALGQEIGRNSVAEIGQAPAGKSNIYPGMGKDAARGAGLLAQAGFEAATPLAVASGVAAPLQTAVTLGTGIAAQKLTAAGLEHFGVAPEYADLAGDIAGIAAGYGAHNLAEFLLSPKVPPQAKALVEALRSGAPPDPLDPNVPSQVKAIMELVANGKTPGERNAARQALRRKFNINLTDEVPAQPQPEEAHQEAAPAPPPPPVANVSEFTRAHNAWNAATIKAATSFMQDNPGVSLDEAKQAVDGTVGREPKIEDYRAPPQPPPPPAPPAEAAPPPEPPKPTKVQRVSPATPNPPTAAIPTAPESPETIALQLQQLGRDGDPVAPDQRKVVMFPGGQGMPPLESLGGLHIARDKFNNIYVFRPDLIDRGAITSAASNNKLPEILGGPLGMGAPDKTALQGPPVAVRATDANGVEAQTTVTDAQNLPQTVASTHAVTPPGGTVSVVPPEEAIEDRTGLRGMGTGAAQGITENMYGMLWDKAQRGDVTEAGAPSAVLQGAKLIRDQGGLKSPEEFKQYVEDYAHVPRGPAFQVGMRALVEKYVQNGGGPHLPAGQVTSPAIQPQAQSPVTAAPVPPGVPPPPPGFTLQKPPLQPHGLNVPGYVGDELMRRAEFANQLGVIPDIERMAAERKTAIETAIAIGRDKLGVYDPADPNTAQNIVRAVRGYLRIPSMDDRTEFEKWLENKQITKPYNVNSPDLGTTQPAAAGGNPPSPAPGAVPEGNEPVSVREPSGIRGTEAGTPPAEPVGGSPGVGARGTGETVTGEPKTGIRRITGSADIPLTPAGRAQAADLAKKAVVPFNIIVHSPSQRSAATAAAFPGPKLVRQSLNGWGRAATEGQPADDPAVKAEMARLILNPDEVPAGVSPISGLPGQSWNGMAKPMFKDIFGVLRGMMPGERILVITSGGNLQAIDEWGKAGYPASGNFDHTDMASKPYWSVTGKLFKLDAGSGMTENGGLTEVPDDREPGLYLAEHGSTAFNSPGEKGAAAETSAKVPTPQVRTGAAGATPLGVPSSRGAEPTTTRAGAARPQNTPALAGELPQQNLGPEAGGVDDSVPAEQESDDENEDNEEESGGSKVAATAPFGSERGSFTVPPSLEKFYESDLKPAAKWVSQRVTGGLDDLKKVFAPQTRGPAARRGAGVVRERGAEMDQRRDRAFALLKDFKNHFYKDTPEVGGFYGLDVWDAIETGRTMGLSPTDRAFALAARSLLDPRKDELIEGGILKNYRENYLPREWKDESDATNWVQSWQSKRPMAGTEAFRRQRTYPTMKEGIEDPDFHLVPKFDNPVDMLMSKIGQMDQSITAHRAFEEMYDQGDLKYVQFGRKPPVGWQKIDDKLFTVNGPRFGAVELPDSQVHSVLPEEDMEEGGVRPEDVRVHGQRIMGHYYAPEPLARVINNHLSQGIDNSGFMELWRGSNNLMNMMELTASYYHGMTTTLNSSLSDMALGIEQALNGRPIEGAKAIGRGIVPFASVIQDYMKGTAVQKAWDMQPDEFKNLTTTDPVTWAIVDTLKAAGGKPRQDQFYTTGFYEGLKDAWEKGNPIAAAWRAPFAALEQAMKPIMKYLVPRVKLGAFAKLAVEELQHHPTMTRDQMRAQFGQIWNSVDNRFGQLAQRNLLMHALARGAMNAVIGRPGWNLGSVQEILGGVGDAANNLNDFAHGRTTRISHKTAYVLAMLLGGTLLNGIYNLLLTTKHDEKGWHHGDLPTGWDWIFPRDGGVTEDGRPSRIVLPTYLAKDIYSYATNPWRTIKAKAAPLLTLGLDLAENRDFYGHKIRGERGIGLGNYLVKEFTPYALTGLFLNQERGASVPKQVLPFVGIMPAGKRVGLSKAEQMITEYQDEQRAQTRAPSTQRNKAETKVFLDARRGDQKKAQQDGQKAVAAGLMSPADVRHSIDRAKQTPLVADYKRVTDFRTAMEIYDAANESEKKTIYREARNKAFLAQSKPWLWQNADGTPDKQLRTVVQMYFGMKPYQPRAYTPPSQFTTPPPIGAR